jgi:hypothetical protein
MVALIELVWMQSLSIWATKNVMLAQICERCRIAALPLFIFGNCGWLA